MNCDALYIADLVSKGGPVVDDYPGLQLWFRTIARKKENGELNSKEITGLQEAFGESFSLDTVQGFCVQQPHGYAGDFEIIDRIHTNWISPKSHLQKWDHFFHAQAAPNAVRNRKVYFQNILEKISHEAGRAINVLNVGSGPGRDMEEYFFSRPRSTVHIDCVDMDAKAIAHASHLNRNFLDKITFHHRNIFRFRPQKSYDLIWSAGLFDYLDERSFRFLLQKFIQIIKPGGQVVIGNFSPNNPSRDYMEFGRWNLIHRDKEQLRQLAETCNIWKHDIIINSEPEGVNLFLHVKH